MACVGVPQVTPFGVENGIEAGDEHVGGYAGNERFVDSLEHLPGRGVALGCKPQHPAGSGHHKCCWHALPRSVPHDHSQASLREEVEVVEVSSYLAGGSVEWRDLPALQRGHL